MRKLRKDERRWLEWLIANDGAARDFTLGKGRPHDQRTLAALVDATAIKLIYEPYYAILGAEDENGLALFKTLDDVVFGATCHGQHVRHFTTEDYEADENGSAQQNGHDTARELYPDDEVRRSWMQSWAAKSTLLMILDCPESYR